MATREIITAVTSREEVEQVLFDFVTRQIVDRFGKELLALFLTGSLARGEGSLIHRENGWQVLGDAEFLAIFGDGAKLISDQEFDRIGQQIARDLKGLGITCRLDLSAAHLDYLQKMRPHIFAYELRSSGKTLWGDPELIEAIPSFSATQIPREDAWRMFCNRIIEQLRTLAVVHAGSPVDIEDAIYSCNKFFLDLATSLLIFLNEYEPTYQLRAEKISRLAQVRGGKGAPFPLAKFARRVTELTAIKLRPELDPVMNRNAASRRSLRDEWLFRWLEAVPYARALWEWEVSALVGGLQPDQDSTELARRLLRKQSVGEKMRGWFYVFSNPEFRFGFRDLPQLARCVWTGSPRYLTYVAASQLYFSMPSLLDGAGRTGAVRPLQQRPLLPVYRYGNNGALERDTICQEIVWNYENFLTRTRH